MIALEGDNPHILTMKLWCIPLSFVLFLAASCREAKPTYLSPDIKINVVSTESSELNERFENAIRIEDESTALLQGCHIIFGNYLKDSRNTPVAFEKWRDALFVKSGSQEEAIWRVVMYGIDNDVYYLDTEGLNKVILIAPSERTMKWTKDLHLRIEVWDKDGISRICGHSDCQVIGANDAVELCRKLSVAILPEN